MVGHYYQDSKLMPKFIHPSERYMYVAGIQSLPIHSAADAIWC